MAKTVRAIFTDRVFKPEDPVDLPENARVRLTVEPREKTQDRRESKSFFDACRAVAQKDLQLPADFSKNIDDYLYRGKPLKP